jgi:hypothetical protein
LIPCEIGVKIAKRIYLATMNKILANLREEEKNWRERMK